jgi:transcriptional regulator with XRE-family HTH domain
MKDRILAFLQNENKSYAQFADEIGVQPSGISHILSGRNNPSLDFVIKMLHRYPSLSADWLLFGKGPMYRNISQPTLFDETVLTPGSEGEVSIQDQDFLMNDARSETENFSQSHENTQSALPEGTSNDSGSRKIERIVMFYTDKTFTEYKPS